MTDIALGFYDWVYGTVVIAVVFLSLVAGILAISLFKAAFKNDEMKAWRFLIFTHIIPSLILATLIAALVNQIYINKGCA